MEYTTQSLSKLAKISTRTLRYYDEIGLLKPKRKASNGYRIYGQSEVDRLQQILFYKAMGMELDTIKQLLDNPCYDAVAAMENHLEDLIQQQHTLESLIEYVNETIHYMKGEKQMTDKKKFEIYKEEIIKNNEEKYGAEAREKYGDEAVDFSNMKIRNASQQQLEETEQLSQQINVLLKQAVREGDPASPTAQKLCEAHKKWISFFWKSYNPKAHLGLCKMYTQDERFRSYYEDIAPNGADFLCKAVELYISKEI